MGMRRLRARIVMLMWILDTTGVDLDRSGVVPWGSSGLRWCQGSWMLVMIMTIIINDIDDE